MSPSADRGRLESLAAIGIFDVVGPLVAYYSLRSAGLAAVAALILSGLLPAIGIALCVVRRRRLDAIGGLVLIGIVAGSALGLTSRSTHLVLLDGTVPSAVFGIVCLGSLWSRRPMVYTFALEAMGVDTPKGRAFAERWCHPAFRHAFRVATAVWGAAFVIAAAVQVVIIQTASTATAQATSNLLPLAVAGLLAVWNIAYAKRGRRRGGLAVEARRARGDTPPAMPT